MDGRPVCSDGVRVDPDAYADAYADGIADAVADPAAHCGTFFISVVESHILPNSAPVAVAYGFPDVDSDRRTDASRNRSA